VDCEVVLKSAYTSDKLLYPDGLETVQVNGWLRPLPLAGETDTAAGAVSTQA
jgi:hypothetical protein